MEQRFTKLVNFRDLGGISAAEGRKVVPGRLLRSGELAGLPENDIRLLCEEYHLVNIADLRTENERTKSPDSVIAGTSYFTLDFFTAEAAKQANCIEERLENMQSMEQLHKKMEETYGSFITEEPVRKALYEFLQLLLRTEKGATLFHCFAGKDRTGVTAAVILTILGVSKSDIVKDYLETNILRKEANGVIVEYLRKAGKPEAVLDALHAALCVEERYLEASYERAISEYGSFEDYITDGIGFKEVEWEQLRSLYLK